MLVARLVGGSVKLGGVMLFAMLLELWWYSASPASSAPFLSVLPTTTAATTFTKTTSTGVVTI